jgi:glycine oxidase
MVIGATIEDVGFDKQTTPETIHRLHAAAIAMLPALMGTAIHDAWAGLRPGTPDHLPILGATEVPGYFVAAGHYRDGILLAPITAHVMGQLLSGEATEHSLAAFSPMRFLELKRA